MAAESPRRNREYVRPIPIDWWVRNPRYVLFICREAGSVFLLAYAVLLLRLMHRAPVPGAFQELVSDLKSPLWIAFHVLALAAALLNTITTFNLAPRVLKFHRGEEPVPEALIAGAHYAVWIVVSLAVLFVALRS